MFLLFLFAFPSDELLLFPFLCIVVFSSSSLFSFEFDTKLFKFFFPLEVSSLLEVLLFFFLSVFIVSLSMHRHWIIWTCDPEISNWKSAVVTVSRFYCC